MNVCHVYNWCVISALVALGASFGLNKATAQPAPAGAEDGMEVLTRGPVHEAFAGTVMFDPEPGIVVPKTPPAAIEELPPDQKPEGANVAWVPGYWGWDDERSDFLWVSGIWRALPPGRQWVPGYWGRSEQGIQWTSGYWADAAASEVAYLPEPPASVETGPNIAATSADETWLPGCWVWNNGRYAWRPGFWAAAEPDWAWVPAHYISAPRGYVYVDGYWDYPVARRGVLFAPVYFSANVYTRPGFYYSPATVINPAVFASHLFLRPGYQHYYFGDYYAASYSTAGFYPWYSFHSSRRGYDPIYSHQRWENRRDGQWERRVAADFENRRDHEDARPPRTWADQRVRTSRDGRSGEKRFTVAASLDELAKSSDSPLRFQPVDKKERERFGQQGQEMRKFREEREKLESRAAARSDEKPSQQFVPPKMKFSRSPIAAQAEQIGKNQAPPKSYQAPAPDLRVEAKPRGNRTPQQPQSRAASRLPLDTEQRLPDTRQPRVGQPAQPPRVERPAQQPQIKTERPAPQSQPQTKTERPAPQPQPQTRTDRPAPSQSSERSASQRQSPSVERPAPSARDNSQRGRSSEGPKQDRRKSKD